MSKHCNKPCKNDGKNDDKSDDSLRNSFISILRDEELMRHFQKNNRTNQNLKDRWRTMKGQNLQMDTGKPWEDQAKILARTMKNVLGMDTSTEASLEESFNRLPPELQNEVRFTKKQYLKLLKLSAQES